MEHRESQKLLATTPDIKSRREDTFHDAGGVATQFSYHQLTFHFISTN